MSEQSGVYLERLEFAPGSAHRTKVTVGIKAVTKDGIFDVSVDCELPMIAPDTKWGDIQADLLSKIRVALGENARTAI